MLSNICALEGCDHPSRSRGWCKFHYQQWYQHEGLKSREPRHGSALCKMQSCGQPSKCGGLCGTHYTRQKKYGDPLFVKRPLRTHGMSRTSEYRSWVAMRNRCYKSWCRAYDKYGARGITVCERWRNSFEDFYDDMGPKPTPLHSIDRIDGTGNYEPGNCRWATKAQQSQNTKMRRNNTSGYRGVVKSNSDNNHRWQARIRAEGKILILGTFDSKIEAARAYNAAALKYFGDDAKLNDLTT